MLNHIYKIGLDHKDGKRNNFFHRCIYKEKIRKFKCGKINKKEE